MMSQESLKSTLAPVLRVLRDLGGKFVFTDDEGETFVIMSKKEMVKSKKRNEQQLTLPSAEAVTKAVREYVPEDMQEDVIENINRDIALSVSEETNQSFDDLAIPDEKPFKKVRFEPIKGDLSPDLQD